MENVLGPVAQLGERRVRNAEAEGSNPFGSTIELDRNRCHALKAAWHLPFYWNIALVW